MIEDLAARMRQRWYTGTGAEVLAVPHRARQAARRLDEVMISPIAGSFDGEPLDTAPGRIQTLEQLAPEPARLNPAI